MNTETTSSEYLLLFRGTDWGKGLSPAQVQNVMGEWMAWFDRLSQEGKLKAGQPLKNEGKIVSGVRGRNAVADGPFAESKEAIGGYFMLQVDTMEEAVKIASQCPGLDYGLSVEVRPVAERCPLHQKAEEMLAHASA